MSKAWVDPSEAEELDCALRNRSDRGLLEGPEGDEGLVWLSGCAAPLGTPEKPQPCVPERSSPPQHAFGWLEQATCMRKQAKILKIWL